MKCVNLICAICGFVSSVISQESTRDSTKIYPLKEVVVTATRSEKETGKIGKSVSLITREQIQSSFYNNLSELISSQEGIYIVGTGQNYGMNQSIFMRGANSNQTTVMIDGVRITDPSSVNDAPDLSELSLSNIDRIEIVRGLNSTLYGSSSLGGVINMLTRKEHKSGFNVGANLKAGTFGERTSIFGENFSINYNAPIGCYVNADVNNVNVKGLDATIDTVVDPKVFKHRDKDNFKHRDMIGKVGFVDDRWDIYASFKRTDEDKDLDKRAYVDDNNYTLEFKRNLFTYGLIFKLRNEANIKFVGGFSDLQRIAVDDSSIVDLLGNNDHTFSDERYKGSASTHEIQINLKLNDFDCILGGSLYRETMSSRLQYYSRSIFGIYESLTNLDNLGLNVSTNSLFFHAAVGGRLIADDVDNISLAVGGRIVKHTSFGTKFVYEVNPSVNISSSTLLYASYATGFNSPSLFQLYAPNTDLLSGISRGNKSLKPERSNSFELGLKQSVNDNVDIALSYFQTQTKDVIEYVYLWDKNIGIDTLGNDWLRNDYRGDTYLNLGDQTAHGIEFNIRSKVDEKLTVIGNMSLVDGQLTYKPMSVDSAAVHGNHVQVFSDGAFMNKESESIGLVRRPSTANLSLVYLLHDDLSLRMDVRYVGRRGDVYYDFNLGPLGALGTVSVSDYTLIDLSAQFIFDEHIVVGGRLENVFDEKYTEIKGFTTRGRGLILNIRYDL
jgi:vitamin B12 transporter